MNKARWYNRLFKDPYFVEEVKDRYPYFYMQKSKLLESLDKYADEIRLSQDANFKKWPIMGKEIWPNPVVFDTYQEEVDYLKNWLSDRMDWLDQAFKEM